MSASLRPRMSGLTSRRTLPVLCAGVLALAACKNSPEKVEEMVKQAEPLAIEAAQDRAKVDLNCGTVKTKVLSREHGDMTTQRTLHRVVYRIEAQGCRRRALYSVACTPNAVCSAMTEGTGIEPMQ